MASNRKPMLSQSQNFGSSAGNFTTSSRLNVTRSQEKCRQGKGSRPLPDPATFKQVVLMLILHLCRRILFFNTHLKILFYIIALLFGSVLCDFFPLPRNYFSKKTNMLNVYFVKLGWGWTLVILGLFVLLSSYVYCCGDKNKVRMHLSRLVIGTLLWFTWTNIFTYIESSTGFCGSKAAEKYLTKATCIKSGNRWYGFDISGHAFLLIFCNLVIMEEVKCMKGWERISELIRNDDDEDSPLQCLTEQEMNQLKISYVYLGPYVKMLFIAITLLFILWDFMLICTILYFHSMTQKLVGGLIAVFTWYITYRLWYKNMIPGLPGQGQFKYKESVAGTNRARSVRSSRCMHNSTEN